MEIRAWQVNVGDSISFSPPQYLTTIPPRVIQGTVLQVVRHSLGKMQIKLLMPDTGLTQFHLIDPSTEVLVRDMKKIPADVYEIAKHKLLTIAER